MSEQAPTPQHQSPVEHGGFATSDTQEVNTAFRGMTGDATVQEVNAHDQRLADQTNAAHFGYPQGTTSEEIGRDMTAATLDDNRQQ